MLLYLNIIHFYIGLVVFYFTDHSNDNSLFYYSSILSVEILFAGISCFISITDSIKAIFKINI